MLDLDTDTKKRSLFENKITKYDKKGRAQVTEMTTPYGTCMSEVVYRGTGGIHPEIHVVVIKGGGMRNIGYLLVQDATEETITNSTLVMLFDKTITERCLSLLLPGGANV